MLRQKGPKRTRIEGWGSTLRCRRIRGAVILWKLVSRYGLSGFVRLASRHRLQLDLAAVRSHPQLILDSSWTGSRSFSDAVPDFAASGRSEAPRGDDFCQRLLLTRRAACWSIKAQAIAWSTEGAMQARTLRAADEDLAADTFSRHLPRVDRISRLLVSEIRVSNRARPTLLRPFSRPNRSWRPPSTSPCFPSRPAAAPIQAAMLSGTEKLDAIIADATKDPYNELTRFVFMAASSDEEVIYSGKGGYAHLPTDSVDRTRLEQEGEPITEDSIFELYSCTKLPTTIAALQLVEQGRLGLDDEVSRYVPECADVKVFCGWSEDGAPQLEAPKTPVTIRMLLTHTSGAGHSALDMSFKRLIPCSYRVYLRYD